MEQNNQMTQVSIQSALFPTIEEIPFQAKEAINVLRGNIQMSGANIKVVAITSALEHEGKSSTAFRLARSFALLGKKTLYIDCDIRNSRIASHYDLDERTPGLSEYLCERAELGEVLHMTQEEGFYMILAGSYAPNPSELVSSKGFAKLLEIARYNFDYVIVDTPPVNPVIDGIVIAKQCDGTVLVVESGNTDRRQVIHAKEQLEYAGIKLLGAVLNKIGTRKSGYGYGQRYGYGYGYGEKKDEKKATKKKRDSRRNRRR